MTVHWPEELRVTQEGRVLVLRFSNGTSGEVSAELLRVESPSAEVKGHGPGQEQLVWGKRHVRIIGVEPVGNYAIRLKFDDGHDTGLYTWDYLAKLMRDGVKMFSAYEAKLTEKGMGRD
ncbi:MAG: DUF971 domain-containing protein [Hyphomicrobiales bacterium]